MQNETPRSHRPRHPIRVVAERTGLTPTLLRAWERRYEVVEPGRSEGGQRLYSDEDVERLLLLRRTVDAGRTISSISEHTDEELRQILAEDQKAMEVLVRATSAESVEAELLDEALEAVEAMDASRLDRELRRLAVTLGAEPFIDLVLAPLLAEIGEGWRAGRLRPAHEHVATAVIKQILGWLLERSRPTSRGRRIVIGMLSGEPHGLGGLLAATSAALTGWEVLFLGEDLPPSEISAAAEAMPAEIVGLSIVSPLSLDGIPSQLRELLELLPPGIDVVLGGARGVELQKGMSDPRVTAVSSLAEFRKMLREMQG